LKDGGDRNARQKSHNIPNGGGGYALLAKRGHDALSGKTARNKNDLTGRHPDFAMRGPFFVALMPDTPIESSIVIDLAPLRMQRLSKHSFRTMSRYREK
jgi:hypothetical protein